MTGFDFPPLGPTGEGDVVYPPGTGRQDFLFGRDRPLYWQHPTRPAYYVTYQLDRPACAFRCHYPGGAAPCDRETADRFIEHIERSEGDMHDGDGYDMYTPEGDLAVDRLMVRPALAEIAKGGAPINVRRRCAEALAEGAIEVRRLGHPEVGDTAVRECVYGSVGAELISAGFAEDNGWDRYNWSEDTGVDC